MSSTTKPTLLILDAHNMIFKAYHALGHGLSSPDGMMTGAVYGFLRMMFKLLEVYPTEHLAVVADAPGGNFREELYAEYKAHRPPMPEDLRPQIPIILDIVQAYRIPFFCVDGVEADDVIASIALWGERNGFAVKIASSDKDLTQIVDEHIHLLNITKGIADILDMGPEQVVEKYGVGPKQMRDYLAMVGDTSDNVPGVTGVGAKTAAELLQEHGDLDRIIEIAPTLTKRKIGEKFLACAAQLPISRELVTLKTDVELPLSAESLRRGQADGPTLGEFYKRLGFRTFLRELNLPEGGEQAASESSYGPGRWWVVTENKPTRHVAAASQTSMLFGEDPAALPAENCVSLAEFTERLAGCTELVLDTETTSLDTLSAELVGVAVAFDAQDGYYLPVAHQTGQNLALDKVKALLSNKLSQEKLLVIGHNLKYDLAVLARHGLTVRARLFDTMIAAYLVDPRRKGYKLDDLAQDLLGHSMIPISALIGEGKQQTTFDTVPVGKAAEYSAEDAYMTRRLYEQVLPQLQEQELTDLAADIEMPLVAILAEVESTGVLVDRAELERLNVEVLAEIEKTEQLVYALAGQTFNINSPKQLNQVLFEDMKLPTAGLDKTTHGFSTNEANLQRLTKLSGQAGEFVRAILDHRALSKLNSTYIEGLLRQIHPKTGRVHTSLQQTVAETGRLSSTDPNLQNIPIREGVGQDFRKIFVAPPGYKLLSADYSQVELRILADVANVTAMIEAFQRGEDIHARTASLIFGIPAEQVSRDQRSIAKMVNFGIDYGMTAFGLSDRLGIEVSEARAFIKSYFKTFPEIQRYIDETGKLAEEQGYVRTVFGRKRPIPEIKAANWQVREAAKRRAINMPIQGTAADLIKMAMLACHKRLSEARLPARMILQIHDELLFEVREDAVGQVSELVRSAMEGVASLKVPLQVDVGVGANWYEAH